MKKCPNCNQMFSDENLFCLNDGASLLNVSDAGQIPPFFQTPADTPTQFIPRLPTNAPVSAPTSNWLYLIIGVMATTIIALGVAFYFSRPANEKENNSEKTAQTADNQSLIIQSSENKPQNNQTERIYVPSNAAQNETPTKQIEIPPLTTEAVQELINRWVQAQNARNYNAYKACYAPQFFGIKRTRNGDESRMNYGQWMNDRRKMLKNTINVGIQIQDIKTESDTATAQFIQQFESVNYQDTGQKTLKIKMFPDGAKIIYEELKYAY